MEEEQQHFAGGWNGSCEFGGCAIRNMESVVATVSGYHGSERFNLIKAISYTGANYVGAMSRSTTHLVCSKFEGRKYDLAMKFRTIIVNHKWIEDCIKVGKRIPEDPYMLKSGEEVGPLSSEVLLIAKKASLSLTRNCKWLSVGRSVACHDHNVPVIDLETRGGSQDVCADSSFLNENEESSLKNSMWLVSQKCDAVGSSVSAEPSHKSRKLLKRTAFGDKLDPVVLDSGKKCPRTRDQASYDNGASSNSSNGNILVHRERSKGSLFHCGDNRNNFLENLEEGERFDRDISLTEDTQPFLERISQVECSGVEEALCREVGNGQAESSLGFRYSTELSCVICWTDFSSTRGFLPCGHRFCYSCIQSWADHMVARRQISTCPLCKASFSSIIKVDDAATCDQKIYSQTIPQGQSMDGVRPSFEARPSACWKCHYREPEDLLISCHVCKIGCIHSYCLDPPLLPWTCIHCRDSRALFFGINN